MTAVSQIIPNFVQGINEQPDEQKKPGQVRDAVNCIPDVTEGLIKRPGYELLMEMEDIDGSGTWFEMYREDENGLDYRYVINVDKEGVTRAWNADTKQSVPVYGYGGSLRLGEFDRELVADQTPIEYLINSTGKSPLKLREVVINDAAFIVNPHVDVSMSISDETPRPYEAFIELTKFDPSRSYNFTVDMIGSPATEFSKITRVEQIDTSGLKGDNNRLEGCPLVNRWRKSTLDVRGKKDYTNIKRQAVAPVEMEIELGARPKVGGEWDDNAYCNYFIANTRLLDGGLGWRVGDVFRLEFGPDEVEGDFEGDAQDFDFTFEVTEVVSVSPTVDFQISAGDTSDDGSVLGVLGKLKNQFESRPEFTTVEIVGNGLYIVSNEPFLIDTSEKDLANILCTQSDPELEQPNPIMTVNNASNLPLECKVGVVVKVENSFSEDDDYYVRFANDYLAAETTSGQGYWKECPKPLEKDLLNPDTMPHILFHDQPESDISSEYFVITNISYDRRNCGDADKFNPSFEGEKITNLAFFRNRLIAFSNENIISTAAGDYDNWFPSTALTVSPSDPIDIAATTNYSSILYGGIVINNAMVVFSEYNQYLLTTDSDVFDSRTAKVTQIGAYHYNTKSDPVILGTNIAFLGGTDKDSKLYEMYNIFREGQVDVIERSKVISKSFADGFDMITSSRDNGTITMGKYGTKELWMYKYFKEGNQNDVQTAWVRHILPDELVFHFNSRESHYFVGKNFSKFFLMESNPEDPVYLDAWSRKDIGYTYDSPIYSEYDAVDRIDGGDARGIQLDPPVDGGDAKGIFDDLLRPEIDGGDASSDYSSAIFGKQYGMVVNLPTFYVLKNEQQAFRADTTASLTIHRLKMNTGPTNVYDVIIDRYGKDPYVVTYEQTMMDGYTADSDPTRPDTEQSIPLYERNTNLNIVIASTYPSPTTLYSLRWEGDYNSRYYQRV